MKYSEDNSLFRLSDALSDSDFNLILRAMSDEEISVDEVYVLLTLVDKFLPKKNSLEKITAILIHHLSTQDVYWLAELKDMLIWKEIAKCNFSSDQIPIKLHEREVELEGLNVTVETKDRILNVFSHFSEICTGIRFKNIPLDIDLAILIQSMFKPHLISVSFENCPFIFGYKFDFQFDFSELKNLTHFQYSDCDHDGLLSMWETISSDKLVYLDISRNHMQKNNQEKLMKFLMRNKNLKTLNVCGSESCKYEFPKITGNILNLNRLESMNLTGNLDMESFIEKLGRVERQLNFKDWNYSMIYLISLLNRSVETSQNFPT